MHRDLQPSPIPHNDLPTRLRRRALHNARLEQLQRLQVQPLPGRLAVCKIRDQIEHDGAGAVAPLIGHVIAFVVVVIGQVAEEDVGLVRVGGHEARGFVAVERVWRVRGAMNMEVGAGVVAVEGGALVVVSGDGELVHGVVVAVGEEGAFIVGDEAAGRGRRGAVVAHEVVAGSCGCAYQEKDSYCVEESWNIHDVT